MAQAANLGLLPDSGLPDDYSVPMTRQQFRLLSMQFIAAQNHSDLDSFQAMVALYRAEKDETGAVKKVFSDGSIEDSYAYYIGLLSGDETGTCRPDEVITRQETATILMRIYSICGGTAPTIEALPFQDAGSVADWAKDSVSALSAWGVIKGIDGNFVPDAPCSIEQGILFLTRLHENPPVRPGSGNTAALFTQEQCFGYIDGLLAKETETAGLYKSLQIDGPQATFLRLEMSGVMVARSSFYMLHKNGGVMEVDLGICNTPQGEASKSMTLENLHFSQDGGQLLGAVTLPEDVISTLHDPIGAVMHKQGTYSLCVDVEYPSQGKIAAV